MKHVVVVVMGMLLIAGCGVGFGPVTGLVLPADVRLGCLFWADDRRIERLLFFTQLDADDGASRSEVEAGAEESCDGDVDCLLCARVVIDEVFGN